MITLFIFIWLGVLTIFLILTFLYLGSKIELNKQQQVEKKYVDTVLRENREKLEKQISSMADLFAIKSRENPKEKEEDKWLKFKECFNRTTKVKTDG